VDKFNRPDWDDYFMSQAFLVAQRSLDPHTKHGCVVVGKDKTVLAQGYNGPPRGCNDDLVDMERPLKYAWMAHAEMNAIANAARSGVSLKDSVFYITGKPCVVCFRSIINAGAIAVVYGPVVSKCENDEEEAIKEKMNYDGRIEVIDYSKLYKADTLYSMIKYIGNKCEGRTQLKWLKYLSPFRF
jgi:dCMP deaminase